jgi:hypothetical protein
MTSGGSVPNKKGFIINISDRSKAHIQFSIVGYYAWLVMFLIVRLIIFDVSFLENCLQLIENVSKNCTKPPRVHLLIREMLWIGQNNLSVQSQFLLGILSDQLVRIFI